MARVYTNVLAGPHARNILVTPVKSTRSLGLLLPLPLSVCFSVLSLCFSVCLYASLSVCLFQLGHSLPGPREPATPIIFFITFQRIINNIPDQQPANL